MTENRRIILNVAATWSRNVFKMACGLLTSRWVLLSLGQTDYGLYGLVAGLTVFVSFINRALASANSRFYAYSVGQARAARDKEKALDECRRWFNTALSVHTAFPLLLLAIGYPVGIWMIERFLTIPPERIPACVMAFRFACITCLVGMFNVPFRAMYVAKQRIAELTVYSYAQTVLTAGFAWYMMKHPGDWLQGWAMRACLLSVTPKIIICVRSFFVFRECRVRLGYMWDMSRIRQLGSFAGLKLVGIVCKILRSQGVAILVNKAFGPTMNAALSVARHTNARASSFAQSMVGAFSPAITQAAGAGRFERMCALVFRSCKFSLLLTAMFTLPLAVDAREVLVIWLKRPPEFAAPLCLCILVSHLINSSAQGQGIAISAGGRIARFQIWSASVDVMILPLMVAGAFLTRSIYSVGILLVCSRIFHTWVIVRFATSLMGVEIRYWLRRVVLPVSLVIGAALLAAALPRLTLPVGPARVLACIAAFEAVFLPLTWLVAFDDEERTFVRGKGAKVWRKLFAGREGEMRR